MFRKNIAQKVHLQAFLGRFCLDCYRFSCFWTRLRQGMHLFLVPFRLSITCPSSQELSVAQEQTWWSRSGPTLALGAASSRSGWVIDV